MANQIRKLLLTSLLGGCIFLSACGQTDPVEPSSAEPSASPAPLQWEDVFTRDGVVDWDKYNEYMGVEVPETDDSREVPENVILLGALSSDYKNFYRQVNAFNQAQDDYQVEVQSYESKTAMFLDLVRGKGCDLLVLHPTELLTLFDKDVLEDLDPYLERSEKVGRENLFEGVLEAGTTGGKLTGIMPGFTVNAILVEKGYTKGGGWTIEEYLALMDKYPDVPVSAFAKPQLIVVWLMSDLSALTESYVDWEKRTCSFDSEDFIRILKTLESYAKRCREPLIESSSSLTSRADMLYKRQVQTLTINLDYSEYFESYRDVRDAFLGAYELAGIPNEEGAVKYMMTSSTDILYGMNAASAKKEGAWRFLEYLLSEYQETLAKTTQSLGFPARRDIVERLLREEVEAEVTEKVLVQNYYTGEHVPKRGNFTEEDKEQVLYILDHAAPPSVLEWGGTFRDILVEELSVFFAGDKTAEETAHLIQSRVSLYLSTN